MRRQKSNLQIDLVDWLAGYRAATLGQPQSPFPADVQDRLGYCGGWLEGKAARTSPPPAVSAQQS